MPALLCPSARRASLAASPGCPAPSHCDRTTALTQPCPARDGDRPCSLCRLRCPFSSTCGNPSSSCCSSTGAWSADLSENVSARPSPQRVLEPRAQQLLRGGAGDWDAPCAARTDRAHAALGRGEHRTKDRLLRGRTVWLLICVPLIQQMKTFPWARAVVNPPAVSHGSEPARLRGPRAAGACGGDTSCDTWCEGCRWLCCAAGSSAVFP